ncbi:MAG: lysophospholipid acyltransferase family protein [Alistipes sp.]|nr:lysophospholipid acyltransferase family protein [Alistipes sp.]
MGERIGRAIQRLRTEGLWLFSRSVAVLPYWFQYYVLAEIIRVVLRYVIRYRRRLIIRQLSDSFPEKSGREIVKICNDYYGTLAEMVVNTLTLAGMGDAERARRVTFRGAADMIETVAGRNVVVLTSHHGFWEYDSFASLWMTDHHLVVAYHSIKNEAMDDFYMRLRRTDSVEPVSSKLFMRFYMSHRDGIDGRNLLIGLISDQNSPPHGDVHWYRFLNHDSLFFDGGEQLAMKFGLPVYYLEMNRIRRGYYHGEYKLIYDGSEPVGQYEITERYVRCLEKTIERRPELWMWSHNRWKFRRGVDGTVIRDRSNG